VENSLAHLNAYPFEQSPVDVLFLSYFDRSPATQQFIAEKIKPSQIVAMHIAPAELAETTNKILAVYPHAVIFKESMERRSIPIEVDFHNLTGEYLGQTPPGDTPQAFALGIVSTDDLEHSAPAFSPDGNEVFWYVNRRPGPENKEWSHYGMTMRRIGGKWTAPEASPYGGIPVFSPDGKRLYFDSSQPTPNGKPEGPYFVEKQGNSWSEQKSVGLVARFPELRFAGELSISRNGTLYFLGYAAGLWNNWGLYRAELINGEYTKPELLPPSINAPGNIRNSTPYIAPDESYLIFSSSQGGTPEDGQDILFVCFRQPDGSWTDPVSLGEPINSHSMERFPTVSPDGKYLFLTRWTPDHDMDVYWVSAGIIEKLKAKAIQERRLKIEYQQEKPKWEKHPQLSAH
jgi:hypothetical protein